MSSKSFWLLTVKKEAKIWNIPVFCFCVDMDAGRMQKIFAFFAYSKYLHCYNHQNRPLTATHRE